jgi:hypothetical protein
MKRFLLHLIILVVLSWSLPVWAVGQTEAGTDSVASEVSSEGQTEAPHDSIRFSLLTCAPGSAIYTLFGHTAIRFENLTQQVDLVFNYGMFNFNTPHFIYRFVKGETDYELGVVPYVYFAQEYYNRGSYVIQQELNLKYKEKLKLMSILNENYQPENRVYRYNYFYDNCTTRARDKIEQVLNYDLYYMRNDTMRSFRSVIHEYTAGHPWSEFGIDFLLGAEADKPVDQIKQMFVPFGLMRSSETAFIVDRENYDEVRPYVISETRIVDPPAREVEKEFPITPMQAGWGLFVIIALICWFERRLNRYFWGLDVLLFGAQGVAGCIIAFLFFFSVHPTVDSNFLIIPFNPLPLLYLPILIARHIKGKRDSYYVISGAIVLLFVLCWPIIPQKINPAILPLALCLLLRSVTHKIIVYRKLLK